MTRTKSETAIKWRLRVHLLSYVIANLAQVVVWWLVTPDHFFWPLWSILVWGVGLAFHIRAAAKSPSKTHRYGHPHPRHPHSEH
ncbi:2TM domain-containing protein [Micromonospora sp. WMMD1082]|uniref:2TM domain-containing protein n=1 Tax=Micromonospora sp. WMMD1082 TaxID=3016104 RepID=UPI002415DCBF|nr:2TM domain-containing protein [Micromonospora sp. WMMD1082]MDG4798316.1 2TM domain-containing protein [Micromonospora sp. WMMD1082]